MIAGNGRALGFAEKQKAWEYSSEWVKLFRGVSVTQALRLCINHFSDLRVKLVAETA